MRKSRIKARIKEVRLDLIDHVDDEIAGVRDQFSSAIQEQSIRVLSRIGVVDQARCNGVDLHAKRLLELGEMIVDLQLKDQTEKVAGNTKAVTWCVEQLNALLPLLRDTRTALDTERQSNGVLRADVEKQKQYQAATALALASLSEQISKLSIAVSELQTPPAAPSE